MMKDTKHNNLKELIDKHDKTRLHCVMFTRDGKSTDYSYETIKHITFEDVMQEQDVIRIVFYKGG